MLYLLDTNTVSYIVSGRSLAARKHFKNAMDHATVAISTITQAETLFGLENKPGAVRLRATIEELFDAVHILPWDATAAHIYSRLRVRMAATGKTLSALDMLIAAHAVAAGATLITRDKAFLHAAPQLNIEDWAADL